MDVFVLWHVHELPGGEDDIKLVGVYASAADAEAARGRAAVRPGFRDAVEGFQVDQYTVGEDQWDEGFVAEVEAGGPPGAGDGEA